MRNDSQRWQFLGKIKKVANGFLFWTRTGKPHPSTDDSQDRPPLWAFLLELAVFFQDNRHGSELPSSQKRLPSEESRKFPASSPLHVTQAA